MAEATGYGNNSTAQNVFSILFDEALSSEVQYEAYDNDQTFPAVDTATTYTNDVLAGTTGNGDKSMVALVDTTNAAPTSAWLPASATAGEANPNRLKGQVNYVQQDGTVRDADERVTFNMAVEVPSDATTSMAMGFDLLARYTYTGTAPSPVWSINTGTEGTPVWTTVTPGTHGLLHCRTGSGATGSGGDGHYYANIPTSGVEVTVECHSDTNTNPED
jgi:hypothetical protein